MTAAFRQLCPPLSMTWSMLHSLHIRLSSEGRTRPIQSLQPGLRSHGSRWPLLGWLSSNCCTFDSGVRPWDADTSCSHVCQGTVECHCGGSRFGVNDNHMSACEPALHLPAVPEDCSCHCHHHLRLMAPWTTILPSIHIMPSLRHHVPTAALPVVDVPLRPQTHVPALHREPPHHHARLLLRLHRSGCRLAAPDDAAALRPTAPAPD